MTHRRVLSLSTRRLAELYSASPLALTRRKYCRYFPLRVYTLAGPSNKSALVGRFRVSNYLPSTLEGPLCNALQTSFASAQKPSSGPSSCLRGTRTSASWSLSPGSLRVSSIKSVSMRSAGIFRGGWLVGGCCWGGIWFEGGGGGGWLYG